MDHMQLLAVIFQGIPESLVVFAFGVAVVGEYLNWKRILICAIIVPFLMMVVRAIVPIFGPHIVISLIVTFIFFWKIIKLDLKKAIFSSLLSMCILLLLEIFILPIFYNIWNTTLFETYNNTFQRILFPYPVLIIYAIFTFIIYKFKFALFKGDRVNTDE